MRIEQRFLHFTTTDVTDILDLTGEVVEFLGDSGLHQGTMHVFTPGSTAAITTLEFESGAIADLARAIERLAPRDGEYQHNLRWHDGNGYSHVRAALLGPSLSIPILNAKLELGTWQQIILCDFDNRPRRRKVILQAIGQKWEEVRALTAPPR